MYEDSTNPERDSSDEGIPLESDASMAASQNIFTCWQAPDRDSPAGEAIDFRFVLDLEDSSNAILSTLLKLDGVNSYDEEEVRRHTGVAISRPRRWGKYFERMGIMYRDGQITRLTAFGKKLAGAGQREKVEFRRNIATDALRVLSQYQLKNPADEAAGVYPNDCDVFPYWCIWKAADELGGCIHWDELNRELMRVLKMSDLQGRIEKIRTARNDSDYDPVAGGSSAHRLDERCHDEDGAPRGRSAGGQVRDHYTTPWLKKAGFGGLLLTMPGHDGRGYWTIPEDLRPLVKRVLQSPPSYRTFRTREEWFSYYGSLPEEEPMYAEEDLALPDEDAVWKEALALLEAGSLTVILSGPPGTSKTWYARRIAHKIATARGHVREVQFHPSFSYDDFIEGYVPSVPQGERFSLALFQIIPKIFLSLCDQAQKSPDEKFVLVIDEINRGDVSRIFGELLTYLEPSYRERTFTLAYSGRMTAIPKNVIVVGTMNPYDRSITELDDALERRFSRIALNPSTRILRTLLVEAGAEGPIIEKIMAFFKRANELVPHGLGHVFFKGIRSEVDLVRLWNHNLKFVADKAFRFDPEKLREIRTAFEATVSDASLLA